MRRDIFPFMLLTGAFLMTSNPAAEAQEAPRPERRPVELTNHGVTRVDEYYWLREREDPAVIAHLEAENAWTQVRMAGTEELQSTLFDEIVGRIPPDDDSAPIPHSGWWYQSRYEAGNEYPVHVRMKDSPDAPAQVLLDGNERAEGHSYYSARVSPLGVSPDGRTLAFAEDTLGRRFYTIRFKDLQSGRILPDEIRSVTPVMVWANDSETLFYTKQDPETLRWYQIYRHRLGSDPSTDPLVYEEADETYSSWVSRSKSGRFLLIGSSQTLATEYRYLDAERPDGAFQVILPRQRDHEYSVEHDGDSWLIKTNRDAKNFRLVRAPIANPGPDAWEELLPARDEVLFEDFELDDDHRSIIDAVDRVCSQFDDEYWSSCDRERRFPSEFYDDFVENTLAVSGEQVRNAARKWLNASEMAIVLAGDRAAIEELCRRFEQAHHRLRAGELVAAALVHAGPSSVVRAGATASSSARVEGESGCMRLALLSRACPASISAGKRSRMSSPSTRPRRPTSPPARRSTRSTSPSRWATTSCSTSTTSSTPTPSSSSTALW